MGTMAIYYDNIPSRNTPGYFIELEESVSGAAYPLKWKINQLTDASAFINSLLEIPETPARSAEHQLLHLQEEGERLKSLNATLLKNIYDLNNYYRFVRGETTFKHHNREEPTETTNALPPGAGVEDYKKIL